jgi:curved DNA-binding protein CbpA
MDIDRAFEILGFPDKYKVETMGEVNTKYRKLVLQYHPDKTRNDENMTEIFKNIANAYQVIASNPEPLPYERPTPRYAAPRYAAPPAASPPRYAAHSTPPAAAANVQHYSGVEIPSHAELKVQRDASKAQSDAIYKKQAEISAKQKPFIDAAAEVADILKQGYNKSSKKNPLFGGPGRGLKPKSYKKRKQTKKRKGKK